MIAWLHSRALNGIEAETARASRISVRYRRATIKDVPGIHVFAVVVGELSRQAGDHGPVRAAVPYHDEADDLGECPDFAVVVCVPGDEVATISGTTTAKFIDKCSRICRVSAQRRHKPALQIVVKVVRQHPAELRPPVWLRQQLAVTRTSLRPQEAQEAGFMFARSSRWPLLARH